MSASLDLHAAHAAHDGHHDNHHEGHDDDSGYHATVRGYVTGFLLSLVLTAIPFWLVMGKVLPAGMTSAVVLGFAAVQMVVHMVYFLHLNPRAEGGWSLLALVFTGLLVLILLAGSVWVMYHLNTNMMPTMDPHTARTMP